MSVNYRTIRSGPDPAKYRSLFTETAFSEYSGLLTSNPVYVLLPWGGKDRSTPFLKHKVHMPGS